MNDTLRMIAHLLVVAVALSLTGCSVTVQTSSGSGGVVIEVGGLGTGSTTGLGGSTETTPTTESETTAALPQPGTTTTAPETTTGTGSSGVSGVTDQQAIDELKTKYGITVSGSYTSRSLQKTLLAARQLYPEDTQNLKINFSDRDGGGVAGVWNSYGQITIYVRSKESIWTIFHETMHHATLFRSSSHGAKVAEEVVTAIGKGRDPRNYPASVITGSYAQTALEEFWAELFAGYQIYKYDLWNSGRAGFYDTFNPPQSLRPTIEKMYAPKTGNS